MKNNFYAEISEGKNHIFLQSTIENQQKGCYLMSRSTPGTLCLRTWSAPGTIYLNAQSTQGTQLKLYEFLKHSGTEKKESLECSGSSNKEYLVCSGTSNNDLFADFQLLIVKNCDVFPQKFQHKNEKPILPLPSGISYKKNRLPKQIAQKLQNCFGIYVKKLGLLVTLTIYSSSSSSQRDG